MNGKPPRLSRREMLQRSSVTASALALPVSGPEVAAGSVFALAADADLPSGVRAVWDLAQAYSEKTPTRERVCLNGLWRWQPAREDADGVPADRWGFFKVPGAWPGITDYLQKDCQTVFAHPDWRGERLADVTTAWYQREVAIPAGWSGRSIALSAEVVNSLATVFIDGARVGEIRFPAGELPLGDACKPGSKHLLSIRVAALPLKAVMSTYTDTGAARDVRGQVARRGLCGDVWLTSAPAGPRIERTRIATSVRQGSIRVAAVLADLAPGRSYTLRVQVREAAPEGAAAFSGNGPEHSRQRVEGREPDPAGVAPAEVAPNRTGGRRAPREAHAGAIAREFVSPKFTAADLKGGEIAFRERWLPTRLWDLNTPGHQDTAHVSLVEAGGKVADVALPRRFGFREFVIQGRDFYLNGSRIYLSAIPIDNAGVGAAWSTYAGARETMARMKSFGINFVYTHNYGCEPGTHLLFDDILRAADDCGMLVALSQPHFSHYDWKAPNADAENGYARHAAFYVRTAEAHPSVVAYAMSHNATSYVEDMNPDMIDGIHAPRESWGENNAKLALRAEAIVKTMDPERIVYHHSSGNLSSMHTSNFYVNFTPVQELCDWFEHWATTGVKPVFLCEYGVPFSWDWAMYRGWYKGKREWGSAVVPWEFCLAEWDAQIFGDRAYAISDKEKANLRWEAAQFRAGRVWHRWDYPNQLGSGGFAERNPVFGEYITANWRAYRGWGVSAFSPWEHAMFWVLRPGVERGKRKELPVDWDRLRRPGYSADYLEDRPDDRLLAYEAADWIPTAAAEAVIRNNGPLLAYIGGKPSRFTSRDHNFLRGEVVEKQIIAINNSRAPVDVSASWSLTLSAADGKPAGLPIRGGTISAAALPTGDQRRVPLQIPLPADLAPGRYVLAATIRFGKEAAQQDQLAIDVLPRPAAAPAATRIALYDPKGETDRMLKEIGVAAQSVGADADLAGFDVLIVGKGALGPAGPGPDIRRVRDGLRVVIMEQTADTLEKRFGFRTAEYGYRRLFPRIPAHALLEGIAAEHLHDWRGDATTSTPRLKYTIGPRPSPEVKWCGIDVTRVWRCGCRGNVASVVIEKPARGDFLPIVDGGYALQYAALAEYREGRGMALFCQLDVSGRTETDPAALRLFRNVVQHAVSWKPAPARTCLYSGDAAGNAHLQAAGFAPVRYESGGPAADAVLVAGPGAKLDAAARDWIHGGGRVLAIGCDDPSAAIASPGVRMRRGEHIAASFDPPAPGSWLAGVSPADVHNRDPRVIPLVAGGAEIVGDGVLAAAEGGRVVFSQLAPWQFDVAGTMNLKRTFRRTAFLTARLLSNLGATCETPLLERCHQPAQDGDRRWLDGLYLDTPEEWDDPYRFFGW